MVQARIRLTYSDRRIEYRAKLLQLLKDYKNILIITVDFVGSSQLQQVRMKTRGEAVVLMGKNTMIRSVLRAAAAENPRIAALIPCVEGNMGFIFTNGDLAPLRAMVISDKLPAAAKVGVIAPITITLPAGPTGLDPGQTSFFQAMNIATKITKGSIEIMNPVNVIAAGERVTASSVALLSKMNIKPFFFGIETTYVSENGEVYEAKILDISKTDVENLFFKGVKKVAALSMSAEFPTQASLPHSIMNAFKKLIAIALTTDVTFEQAKLYKEMAANPDAFKSAAPAGGGGAAAPAAAAKAESSPEEEEEAGFSLFD
jgi:large subunit ribosomal protein LP0